MAGFTNSGEASLLDAIFTVFGATLYLGLSSTTPTETGTGATEPSGGAYARVAVTTANFGAATGGAPTVKSNSTVITFPTATADWVSGANLTNCVLYTASTGGTMVAFGSITTPKPVLNGDTPSFAIGQLVFQAGDPGDTY